MRPLCASAATLAIVFWVINCRNISMSGLLSMKELSPKANRSMPPGFEATSLFFIPVNRFAMTASSSGSPRNAQVESKAPALIPVTISNFGRVPDSPQPISTPAPKAPLASPPDISRMLSRRLCTSSSVGMRPLAEKRLPSSEYWSGFRGSRPFASEAYDGTVIDNVRSVLEHPLSTNRPTANAITSLIMPSRKYI